ncbi:MAG: glycerol-3-phosphate 1-O-acyltransferase PlsY [Holosporales bacterium]|jgi:glycerol-3-phosphate acyltransferase PlsY|nr:glycerol-3-phosphate 1-O-acyltransferase PlsY [Holosporales bacterium]
MANILLFCIIGYLVGSIPFGYIYAKIFEKIDLREFGSNSTGTTNVFRTGNKKLALITLLSDTLKATILVFLVNFFHSETITMLTGFCCILGHVYPIWLGFKGGKGVATMAGVFLFFSPISTLISVVIWGIAAKLIKISSIASLSFGISFLVLNIIQFVKGVTSLYFLIYSIMVICFIFHTHKTNIKRIINQEEKKL